MKKPGDYYGPHGRFGPSRRYLRVFQRSEWDQYRARGGSRAEAESFYHLAFNMAARVELRYSRGTQGLVYVVAWFPFVLPIRGSAL